MKYILTLIIAVILFSISAQTEPGSSAQKNFCFYSSNWNTVLTFGMRIDSTYGEKAAIDLSIDPYQEFTADDFDIRVNALGGVERIDIVVWSDNGNAPDTIITQRLNLFPESETLTYVGGLAEVYDLEFSLASPLVFDAESMIRTYWIEVIAYPNIAGQEVRWSEATAVVGSTAAIVPQGDTDWILTGSAWPHNVDRECVYRLDGDCISVLETAEEDLPEVSIFPNPSVDKIHIEASGYPSMETIQLIDCVGRTKVLAVSNGQVDLSELASGNYYLVLDLSGQKVVRRIVKK